MCWKGVYIYTNGHYAHTNPFFVELFSVNILKLAYIGIS